MSLLEKEEGDGAREYRVEFGHAHVLKVPDKAILRARETEEASATMFCINSQCMP